VTIGLTNEFRHFGDWGGVDMAASVDARVPRPLLAGYLRASRSLSVWRATAEVVLSLVSVVSSSSLSLAASLVLKKLVFLTFQV